MEEYDYKELTEKALEQFAKASGAAAEELSVIADRIASIFGQALNEACEFLTDLVNLLRDLAPINLKPEKRWRMQRKVAGRISERKTRPMTHRPDYG